MPMIVLPDDATGIETVLHGTDEGGIVIEHRQDAQDIIDTNKQIYNEFDERARFKGEHFHRVASLPLVVYFQLKRDGILDDQRRLKKWLNDPDNKYFRTRPGRI